MPWPSRIAAHFRQHGCGLWAVEAPGVAPFIGFAGLAVPSFEAHFTPCLEIGWRLAFAHWGRGYATEAARRVLAHAFGPLACAEIVSFTTRDNRRSRAVMEQLAMQHDPADDFLHPTLPEGHPQRPHVLYRIGRRSFVEATSGVGGHTKSRREVGPGSTLTPDDVGDTDRLHRRTRRPMGGFVERRSPPGRRDRR